jgi:hypothetical protein
MAATSLFLVREALHDLYGAALANVGVELLPAVPTEAEDVSERVLAWWSNEVDVTAQPYTMPNGLVENYQQLLVIKVLPADSDVTATDAQAEATQLLDLVYDTARANRRPLTAQDWDAVVEWGRLQMPELGVRVGMGGTAAAVAVVELVLLAAEVVMAVQGL